MPSSVLSIQPYRPARVWAAILSVAGAALLGGLCGSASQRWLRIHHHHGLHQLWLPTAAPGRVPGRGAFALPCVDRWRVVLDWGTL